MTLLVLCIDRDNDFGTKAGIVSPIVGREANAKAAMALGFADPEDSDMNSVFAAVKIFDEMIARGKEAEVVTICGSQKVGPHSDGIIAEQLDEVCAKFKVDRVVFVSDGAEDEFILPLVTSRARVDSVHRVIVRQHKDLEGTYYIIKKAFEDEKLKRSMLIPFALALIVYGVFAFYGRAYQGIGAIAVLVGLYFMAKIVHVGETLGSVARDIAEAMVSGKFTVFTTVLAGLLVVTGALNVLLRVTPDANLLAYTIAFAAGLLWWLVAAALVHVAGRVLDTYLREPSRVWDYWIMPFSLLALGLLGSAALASVSRAIAGREFAFTGDEFIAMAAGVVVAFVGVGSNAYVKNARRRGPAATQEQAAPVTKAP